MVDYLFIAVYALFLWGLASIFNLKQLNFSPLSAQIFGFVILTLPVFLYFFFFENGPKQGSPGKQLLRLCVKSDGTSVMNPVLIRNIGKLLPWEIAHTGVHHLLYYSESNPPLWVWIVIILPQCLVLLYLLSLFVWEGKQSLYDRFAGTKVEFY